MPPYKEQFSVGTRVRIASRERLEDFKRTWRFHHPLVAEQMSFGGQEATVRDVGFYHSGDVIYALEGVPGVWHERCLSQVVGESGTPPRLDPNARSANPERPGFYPGPPMSSFMQGLFQQTWGARAAGVASAICLAVGLVGWLTDWTYFLRFLYWGVLWAIIALSARAMNKYDPL